MKNKTTVEICGREYSIVSEETEEYVAQLASELDERLRGLGSAYVGMNDSRVMVLTALNLMDELSKSREQLAYAMSEARKAAESAASGSEIDIFEAEISNRDEKSLRHARLWLGKTDPR